MQEVEKIPQKMMNSVRTNVREAKRKYYAEKLEWK